MPVVIDKERCTLCGKCIKDCMANNLRMVDGELILRRACLQCGHCVAICPAGAVSIPDYDMDDIESYKGMNTTLDPDLLLRVIKARRTIRDYRSMPVELEKIQAMLQAARYTATGKNAQSCNIIVVQEGIEELKEVVWKGIADALALPEEVRPAWVGAYATFYRKKQENPANDFLFRNAPAAFFIGSDSPPDVWLAAQNMEHMAMAQGLGMMHNLYLLGAAECIPAVKEWLGAENIALRASAVFGYSNVSYERTAPRKPGKFIIK